MADRPSAGAMKLAGKVALALADACHTLADVATRAAFQLAESGYRLRGDK